MSIAGAHWRRCEEEITCAAILDVWVSFKTGRTLATISHERFPVGDVQAVAVATVACVCSVLLHSYFTS
uniref:Uncharacterized protein n=1 Tax=Oryza nivara TaxID=4536 RepID=A0A0E0GA31_ORYNI